MDDDMWQTVDAVADWLAASSPVSAEMQKVLQILKITEEAGEVAEAVIGAMGTNPRKGFSHDWDDVTDELCDVIVTALVALGRVRPDDAPQTFRHHLRQIAARCPTPS
ncbi:MazG-like family protein [Saccharothrix sp. ST-888]|uniref:MazG-like family protein n=1 Tax=Saccharothrix sp. ST-888 TaxID=1427391 RepID=UPI0005EC35B7|nr:MazG-like family protein [Saccharothrix sp. ST-888]KJK57378.1 hypothetical protein UK12_16730 [Saccharothrix sp. ST-888]